MFHRGLGAIVWNILDNGKTRATISTVGKGVAETPVSGVENFFAAGLAGGDIWRDQLILAFLGNAMAYLEFPVVSRRMIVDGNSFYASQWWSFLLKVCYEKLQVVSLTLNFNLDIFRGIAYPSGEIILCG
jgi:hypothetical protein